MAIYSDLDFLHASGDGGPRSVTQVIVIHATDNTASANAEASYATHRIDKTSAHFYSDEATIYQSLDTSHIAYGCLYHGNKISIQFELCGVSNNITDLTLRRIAPIVARICKDNGIPIKKISPSDVRNGVKGICGHADITLAFPEDNGDHTDPGNNFPWTRFISYVYGGTAMSDADIPGTFHAAKNGDYWGLDLVTGAQPAKFEGSDGVVHTTPNVLHTKLDELKTLIAGLGGLSQEDRALIQALTDAVNALNNRLASP